jgi:hypothetical protein
MITESTLVRFSLARPLSQIEILARGGVIAAMVSCPNASFSHPIHFGWGNGTVNIPAGSVVTVL